MLGGKDKPRRSWRDRLLLVGTALGLFVGVALLESRRKGDRLLQWVLLIGLGVILAGALVCLVLAVWPALCILRARLGGAPVMRLRRDADGVLLSKCPRCRHPVRFTRDEEGTESFVCEECGEAGTAVTQPRGD